VSFWETFGDAGSEVQRVVRTGGRVFKTREGRVGILFEDFVSVVE
jgi:hypothetical protein